MLNEFFSKYLGDITRAINSRSKWKLIQQDFYLFCLFVCLFLCLLLLFCHLLARIKHIYFILLLHYMKRLLHLKTCYTEVLLDFYLDLLIIQKECLDSRNCTCSRKIREHSQRGAIGSKFASNIYVNKSSVFSLMSVSYTYIIGLVYLTSSNQKFSHL